MSDQAVLPFNEPQGRLVVTFTTVSLSESTRQRLPAVQATIDLEQLTEAEFVALVKQANERLRGSDGTS